VEPTGLTADITLLSVEPIAVQNEITQLISNFLSLAGIPAEGGNPSTSTRVIQGSSISTPSIGNFSSTLQIINGGIRLPANLTK
jgi:hypothetical protein